MPAGEEAEDDAVAKAPRVCAYVGFQVVVVVVFYLTATATAGGAAIGTDPHTIRRRRKEKTYTIPIGEWMVMADGRGLELPLLYLCPDMQAAAAAEQQRPTRKRRIFSVKFILKF